MKCNPNNKRVTNLFLKVVRHFDSKLKLWHVQNTYCICL